MSKLAQATGRCIATSITKPSTKKAIREEGIIDGRHQDHKKGRVVDDITPKPKIKPDKKKVLRLKGGGGECFLCTWREEVEFLEKCGGCERLARIIYIYWTTCQKKSVLL